MDFLVLKRALVRAGAKEVPFSSTDANFTGAMSNLAATYPAGIVHAAPAKFSPFVKVFGTAGAEKYVTRKWLTNGPADTLSGPKWTSVVQIEGSKPRRGSLKADHEPYLAALLLKAGSELPALTDAAIWYHRATDLDEEFVSIADSDQLDAYLCQSFAEQLALTNEEIAVLFDKDAEPLGGQSFGDILRDTVANPQEYLPDLGGGSGELDEMLAAFETLANGEAIGLRLGHELLLRFTAALGAKRFLILSGLAGSGKTKLAQGFARWLTPAPEEGQLPAYAVIPVGADWTGNDNILGYPDGLDATRYVTRPALDLIQRAALPENVGSPHFLILDEMNLSHVERYFADLLSLIESGETTELYRPGVDADGETLFRAGVEPLLGLPPNLFIIGTVNVDETTYMFSPKVLDRANVIEFRMSRDELRAFLAAPRSPTMDELNGRGSGFGAAFVGEVGKSLTARLRPCVSSLKTRRCYSSTCFATTARSLVFAWRMKPRDFSTSTGCLAATRTTTRIGSTGRWMRLLCRSFYPSSTARARSSKVCCGRSHGPAAPTAPVSMAPNSWRSAARLAAHRRKPNTLRMS